MEINRWKNFLRHPGKEYRSAPFWAFNGRFEEENLRFQIQEMKQAGMGGFFIHSREGLETPYLSEEWMRAVEQSIDEAQKNNMEVWIYDEDKWPSGSAGGLVSHRDPCHYSAKGLTLEVLSCREAEQKWAEGKLQPGAEYEDGKILGVYTAEIAGDMAENLACICTCKAPSGKTCAVRYTEAGALGESRKLLQRRYEGDSVQCSVIVLRREISAASEWYNGYAPSDNLNPEAVRLFLELTHEKYKERLGGCFAGQIKGFFTDEPNCCDFYALFTLGRPWLTWTDDLPQYFQKRRGYDPLPMLPFLFFEGAQAAKIRHDFWWTVTERFQESYMKQLYDWCEENQVELTGHILYENDLGYQARVCGSAMPQYKYLHRPGIDLLGEQTKEYLTVKQCTSVAHQYGRKHTITETYGCTGWEFGFEGQKWLGDWQFVMGIDRRCQHLAQYSITGCRKRDYPPVFSYQTTWWKYNELLEDYFARISACMSVGEVVRDVMVLHPMTSIWTKCGSKASEDLNHIEMNMGWLDDHITSLNQWGEEYNRLAKMLLGAHIDFDFGDEILLSQDGTVKREKMQGSSREETAVKMGCCTYHTVIVPKVTSLLESTRKLLKEFAAGGGRLIFTAPLPEMIEGRCVPGLAEELAALPECRVVFSYEELLGCLRHTLPKQLRIRNKDGQEASSVLAMLRKTEEGYLLFAVNNDREKEQLVTVEFPETGRVTAYDPWTDTFREMTASPFAGGMRILDQFTPAQSRIYLVRTEQMPKWGAVEFPYEHPHYADPVFAALGPAAKAYRTMENVLTLDTCCYALDGEKFSDEMQVWQAQREIRERLSMQQIYYNGAPQRYFWLNQPHEKDGTPFALRFYFDVKGTVENDCYVVIEKPEQYSVSLNGVPCTCAEGYFLDRDMKRFRLPPLEAGVQELIIAGNYSQHIELEDIYIIGDFAVDCQRRIGKESGKLQFGDWCFQGYYHYPGSMVYEFTLPGKEAGAHQYLLKTGEIKATLAAVRMNGELAGYLMGNTVCELDLTDAMREEENLLEIEVVGSPRNMFGPFHQTYTGCSRISWADFRTEGRFFTSDYVLEPYGILEQMVICRK